MGPSMTWQSLLTAPAPGQHIAQCYTEPGFLARAVGRYVAEGFRQGDGAVVIATAAHRRAITRGLVEGGVPVEQLEARGQLRLLDAAECLASFTVDGMPDRARFWTSIGGTIETVTAHGYRSLRAFGEMVDLLRRTSLPATVRLEELWGELMQAYRFSLLCGYSLDTFDPYVYRGLLQRVAGLHSDLVPIEDYGRLDAAVERAYRDVFGAEGDAEALRRSFLARYRRSAEMPDAAAAIFAVREFVPSTADMLLERVRRHYDGAAAVA